MRAPGRPALLVVMSPGARPADVEGVVRAMEAMGGEARPVPGTRRTAIGLVGSAAAGGSGRLGSLPGVAEVIHPSRPYAQVSREWRDEPTLITLDNGTRIGGGEVVVMAGPTWVESEAQILDSARRLSAAGATLLRGGVFKPRPSPYAFPGLGEAGLRLLARARDETGMAIVTEAVDPESLDRVAEHADIIQIGAHNMQNFSLLRRAGRTGKPVLLRRGMAATVEDLLMSAEYIVAEGNGQVILCERGVKGFDAHNLLDLTTIPVVKSLSHLPIIADPSPGMGMRAGVIPMARAAIAAGADGVMIDVHPDPEHALAHGTESLHPDQFDSLMEQIGRIAGAVGRGMAQPLAACTPRST